MSSLTISISVQFSHSVMSDSLRPHGLKNIRLPVHYQITELPQTYTHQVGVAIQPSHPLSSPSPPAFNLSHIRIFSNESALHFRWPKYWNFSFNISPSNEYSGLISFKMGGLDLLVSPRDCQDSSPTPQFKSINSSGIQLSLQSNSHIHT